MLLWALMWPDESESLNTPNSPVKVNSLMHTSLSSSSIMPMTVNQASVAGPVMLQELCHCLSALL